MNSANMRPLVFGEVLFDRFPDGKVVLGGAPFNVAWHLHAFGLKPLMISRIGDDALGQSIESSMRSWGMDCSGLQKDSLHPTGTVEVKFKDGEPSYDIRQNAAFDFIDAALLPKAHGDWLLYHGSLALRNPCAAAALNRIRTQFNCRRFVDINLRAPWWQPDSIIPMINGADWLKLNALELTEILPDAATDSQRVARLSTLISEQIVLTGGERGARVISSHDGCSYAVVPERTSSLIDTVGAGDAFCSVFMAGRLLDWPLALSMQRAQEFASAVITIRGATSHDSEFYKTFTRRWGIEERHPNV